MTEPLRIILRNAVLAEQVPAELCAAKEHVMTPLLNRNMDLLAALEKAGKRSAGVASHSVTKDAAGNETEIRDFKGDIDGIVAHLNQVKIPYAVTHGQVRDGQGIIRREIIVDMTSAPIPART